MKKNSITISLTLSALLVCVISVVMLVACNFSQGCKHEWRNATCQAPKTCVLCGAIDGEKDMTAHTFDRRIDDERYLVSSGTCVANAVYCYSCICGEKGENTFEVDTSANHAWTEWRSTDDGKHIRTCQNSDGHLQIGDHEGGVATCIKRAICDECGEEYGEPSDEHVIVEDEFVPSVFGKSGFTRSIRCDECGFVFKERKELAPLLAAYDSDDIYESVGSSYLYEYTYSLMLGEDGTCLLRETQNGITHNGFYIPSVVNDYEGTIAYEGNGRLITYKIVVSEFEKPLFVTFDDSTFTLVNSDGSKWNRDIHVRAIGVTETQIVPRDGNGVYGYNDLANNANGVAMQSFYRRLYAACEQFIDSDEDFDSSLDYHFIDHLSVDEFGVSMEEALSVWHVFYLDNPRYYWLDYEYYYYKNEFFLAIDGEYSSAAYRRECDKAIDEMAKQGRLALSDKKTELEKALALHDFVITYMSYAFKDDGVTPEDTRWAHNLVGTAKYSLGVCDAYAKSYYYLCKLNGIDCIIVYGDYIGDPTNPARHAWNLVSIDGEWYGVDCTWDDNNDDEFIYRSYFGMSAFGLENDRMAETPMGYGASYMYELPACSTNVLLPVELYEDGEYVGLFADLDITFAAMTNKNAVYDIILPYMFYYVIDTCIAPKAKAINIVGYCFEYWEGMYMVSSINIVYDLYLSCDLILTDICLEGDGTLNLQNHTLELKKRSTATVRICESLADADKSKE